MSAVLRSVQDCNDLLHWCPGCLGMHILPWKRGDDPARWWTFDGNMESPTFAPSFAHAWTTGGYDGRPQVKHVCHYILTAGVLDFQPDCSHDLRGKVPLPPIPGYPATGAR